MCEDGFLEILLAFAHEGDKVDAAHEGDKVDAITEGDILHPDVLMIPQPTDVIHEPLDELLFVYLRIAWRNQVY
jgi:hypothetical protein